ncbi:hypothetical protein [Cyclobacterium salsum]|uniref:hypothetical protein n=1 Tax=Cyclobacterium salsum TaxID=2666329 RepID=UPI0013910F24|nr:hypothetical protein [Cyclobacterium salsum]
MDGSMAFFGTEEVGLNSGEIVRVYSSKSSIVLQQTPLYSPELSYRSNGTVYTLAFPVPGRNGIRFEEIDGFVQAIADMYVYL